MSLTELVTGVEDHEKTLWVFNADPASVATLRQQFGPRNLTVRDATTPSGCPSSFVVLSQDDAFVTAASVEEVLPDDREPGTGADRPRPILEHLDETTFTSYDTRQMVAASREIEDRAWRRGAGDLHAGFQTLSVLRSQMEAYERLASRADLAVHAYATPDADVPSHDTDMTIHVERADEIRSSWFVVYDGAGDDVDKCALLAEEREPGSFYGFWTYDPDTVDWLVDYLERSYGFLEQ